MNTEQLLVGSLAIVLGATGLVIAVGNWDVCYRLPKMQWLESHLGRAGARGTYAVLGAFLILLGIAIALGFGPNASGT